MSLIKSKKRVAEKGEVYTPTEVVNEMLDRLPQEMWRPDKTFLDPACGNGNMLVEVVRRKIENKSCPIQAIATTYGIDIMEDNVSETKERLLEFTDRSEEAHYWVNKNINCDDSLEIDWVKVDVIITNPPYNGNPNAQRFGKKKEGETKRSIPKSIWAKFMFKSFDCCKHLLFLGPDKWRGDLDFYLTFKDGVNKNRGTKGECWKLKERLMGKRGLKYIKFYGDRIWPDVKASVDIFHWNEDYDGLTEISTLDGLITLDLKDYWDKGNWVLPSRDIWNTHKPLMDKLYNWGVDNKILLRKTFSGLDVKDKTKPQGDYRYAHGVGWFKDEWKWKKEAHIHQTSSKVLISMIRKPRALYYEDCGIGDNMHYCLVKDNVEGSKIEKIINSDDMKEVYRLFCIEGGDPARPPFWMYKWLKI